MHVFAKRLVPLAFLAPFLAFMLAFSETAFSADLSLLDLGKNKSGSISSEKPSRRHLPVTQEVNLRVESVKGDTAMIFLSWGPPLRGTGKGYVGSIFPASISREGNSVKLTCETPGKTWRFTFKPDGSVFCEVFNPEKRLAKWGDLR
jgi:hypothetical protein